MVPRRRLRWSLSALLGGFVIISALFAAFVAIVRPHDDITNHPEVVALMLAADSALVQRWSGAKTTQSGAAVQEATVTESNRSELLSALTNSDHFVFASKFDLLLLDIRPEIDYVVRVTHGTDVLEYEISTLSVYAVLNGKWIGESKLTDRGKATLYSLIEQSLTTDESQ